MCHVWEVVEDLGVDADGGDPSGNDDISANLSPFWPPISPLSTNLIHNTTTYAYHLMPMFCSMAFDFRAYLRKGGLDACKPDTTKSNQVRFRKPRSRGA
ncbi:unnamed protein product [Lactuca virosa]|uniref:Uncharacterized protein n=1 Tax=Lactuca virosa TaxID=75947 RepID=A0AAU9NZY3_9ASTR|nr:unnamed protein product [Lactuca virosa]